MPVVAPSDQARKWYWSIGNDVTAQENRQGWGSSVIKRLGEDLRTEFPEMKGFSPRNLQYMTAFAKAGRWHQLRNRLLRSCHWGHITVLLDKLSEPEDREWYVSAAVEYGWSSNVLMNMIMNNTMERTGAAPSNFAQRLVAQDTELAHRSPKTPTTLSFLASPAKLPNGTWRTRSPAGSPKPSES